MEDELDEQLKAILLEKGYSNCPKCNRELDRGDLTWNSGSTEYGTGYSWVMCHCQRCDTEVFRINSWYPGIDDFDDVLRVINAELEDKKE